MSWTRLDDRFDVNAKVMALGDGVRGDARRWTWTRVLIYTNRNGSPEVPWTLKQVVPAATPGFLTDCVELGLLDEVDGLLEVHDWVLYADVPVSEKVAYLLTKDPAASANHIVRQVGRKRTVVLHEVTRQRGTTEPDPPVPGNRSQLVPGNHQSGSQSGSHARAPVPTPKNEEEPKNGSSSRELATVTTLPVTPQSLVAYFVDRSRELGGNPPHRVTGHVARLCGELIQEGVPPAAVQAGLELLLERRLHPSTLPSLVHEAALPRRPRNGRVTPTEILNHAKQLRAEEEAMFHDAG